MSVFDWARLGSADNAYLNLLRKGWECLINKAWITLEWGIYIFCCNFVCNSSLEAHLGLFFWNWRIIFMCWTWSHGLFFCLIPCHVLLMLVGQNVQVNQMEKHIFWVDMCCWMKEARYNQLIGNACCIYDCTGWLAMAFY